MRKLLFRERLIDLPFVSIVQSNETDDGTLDFWSIEPTGDWARDNKIGREYATEAMQLIRRTDALCLLTSIRRAALQKNLDNATEIGFVHALAEMAMRGVK